MKLLSPILQVYRNRWLHYSVNASQKKLLQYGEFPELTESEWQEVKRLWPAVNLWKSDMVWYRIYKKYNGFSPFLVGGRLSYILRDVFNPYNQLVSLENKSLCDVYFPELNFPDVLVRKIGSCFYDKLMNVMSIQDVVRLLSDNGSYVIKPALGTMQGQGVEKVNLEGSDYVKEHDVIQSFERHRSDFVVQKVAAQHPDIAKLNPTSLNCCRITSIYIGGKYDYAAMIKIGKKALLLTIGIVRFFVGLEKTAYLQMWLTIITYRL